MCDGPEHLHDTHASGGDALDDRPRAAAPAIFGPGGRPTRRTVLAGLGGSAAALAAPVLGRGSAAAAAGRSAQTGQRSVLAAMHLHGSFSERMASWQGQAARMVQESMDLMFMTDHSYLMMASHMADDLSGVKVVTQTSGSLARSRAARSGTGVSLLAESANASPASAAVTIDPNSHEAHRAVRTSVMGQTWRHTFGAVDVDPGGLYEVRIQLSHHPMTAGRPDGMYELVYRFGTDLTPDRLYERQGLTHVVLAAFPASGTTVALDIAGDVAGAWPDLVPEDNSTQYASFRAVSPGAGRSVSVQVTEVLFRRATRTASDVADVYQRIADTYAARYGLAVQPGVELGDSKHHHAFTAHQYFPPDEDLAFSDPVTYTRNNVRAIHAAGGVVSWNHPYGVSEAAPLTGSAVDTRRRAVFSTLKRTNLYGADLLEVGYAARGQMTIDAHLDLWDTFSRHARFLTGNGVSDSHDSSLDRRGNANEFATGIWADSVAMGDILPALLSGRAYTRHAGFWPGGQIDLVVDDTYLMGQVVVGYQPTRSLTIVATNLPSDSVVEVIGSVVDYQGTDPGTVVLTRIPASRFSDAGVASYTMDVQDSAFVRLTVRDQKGTVIGVSNPVWLLRAAPPNGVPAARRA